MPMIPRSDKRWATRTCGRVAACARGQGTGPLILCSDKRWATRACGWVAACASGLLKATTSPTKTLAGEGLGIHRISSFSTAEPPPPLVPWLLAVPLLDAAALLSVGACEQRAASLKVGGMQFQGGEGYTAI